MGGPWGPPAIAAPEPPAGGRSAPHARGLPAGFADLQRAAGNRAVGQLLRAPSIRVRAGSKLSAAELAAVIGGNGNVPAWLRKGLGAKGDALTAGRIAPGCTPSPPR